MGWGIVGGLALFFAVLAISAWSIQRKAADRQKSDLNELPGLIEQLIAEGTVTGLQQGHFSVRPLRGRTYIVSNTARDKEGNEIVIAPALEQTNLWMIRQNEPTAGGWFVYRTMAAATP